MMKMILWLSQLNVNESHLNLKYVYIPHILLSSLEFLAFKNLFCFVTGQKNKIFFHGAIFLPPFIEILTQLLTQTHHFIARLIVFKGQTPCVLWYIFPLPHITERLFSVSINL